MKISNISNKIQCKYNLSKIEYERMIELIQFKEINYETIKN